MRILIPTHAFTDTPQSGLHTVIWNTVRCLAESGHEVHVVSTFTQLHSETDDSLRKKNIYLHRAADFPLHNLNRIAALRCFVKSIPIMLRKKFDWVYVIDTSRTPFGRMRFGAKLAARLLAPKTPEITELQETGDWRFDRGRKDTEEGWEGRSKPLWYKVYGVITEWLGSLLFPAHNYDGADLILCQGQDTLAYWEDKLSMPTVQLPNGIETDVFKEKGPPPRETNRFVFLFVGRVVKRKGIFHLLDAFAQLRKENDNIELWILGKGSQDLIEKMNRIREEDSDHIYYFGEVTRPRIAPFFHHSNCLVDPMIYQGFSTVAVEALFCGKPVIVSRFGGTADVVRDGQNGLLVDPRENDELLRSMKEIYENRDRFLKTAQEGKTHIEQKYAWENIIRQLSDALASIK